MNTKQIDDTIFEALFHQTVIDDYNEEIDSILSNEKLREIISSLPEFELRMRKLFIREKQKEIIIKVLKFGNCVAAVFVVVTTIFFCILLFNYEVRTEG